MNEIAIRPARPDELPLLRAINNEAVPNVNALEPDAMDRLVSISAWLRVAEREGDPLAFLLALRPEAPYASLNFGWFRDRYPDFVYIDRVAVAPPARRLGLGRRLYEELAAWGRSIGAPLLCAEVNLVPPNPGSIAFHRELGFEPAGTLDHDDEGKRVVMLVRRL